MDRNAKIPNLSTSSPTVCKLNFVDIPKRNVSCVTETSEKKQDKADFAMGHEGYRMYQNKFVITFFIYFIKAAKVETTFVTIICTIRNPSFIIILLS